MVIRCTRKLIELLQPAEPLADLRPSDDDWYANLIWIDRRKCVLVAHAGTLFSVFRPDVRAAELRPFGTFLAKAVEAELRDEELQPETFGQLVDAQLARTADRRTLGFMNEMAFQIRWQAEDAGGLDYCDPRVVNRWLRRVLYSKGGYAKPLELVAEWTKQRNG
ncbi:MAG: DUF6933 domain-containing protein [Gaiellaceae bacterium]